MKKTLSILLALVLCLSLGAPAAAAGLDNFRIRSGYTGFYDVKESDWYYESVRTACQYGLVKGNADGSFDPDGSLTVAEAIVMADRVHMLYHTGLDSLENGSPWYQTYVDYALEAGLIGPEDFDSYTRPVTRGEMALIFSGALPYADFEMLNDPENAVPADAVGHRYESAIRLLYQYGIAAGNDIYGNFAPDSNIRRSEAAAIIARAAEPEQRKAVLLLEKLAYDKNVTAAVPVGGQRVDSCPEGYDAGVDVTYGPAGVAVYKTTDVTGGVDGLSVLNIPRDEQQKTIAGAMGVDSITAATLYFGSVPAYRFDFTLTDGGAAVDGC